MRIFLTGFMGAGKSTVGRLLAPLMNMDFVDLDTEIEMVAGRRIAGIFEDLGEAEFRALEQKCLHASPEHAVIATGGGCFIFNTEWMLQNGTVVYLHVPFDALASRIGADPSRPLWKNAEKLFLQRETVYRRAQVIIDASPEADQVARAIRTRL